MKQIILDTSFILSAVRKKIDIFEELLGYQILIPEGVIAEIISITKSNKKLKFREDAELALKLLQQNKFKKILLKEKTIDNAIINFSNQNSQVIVATLDREIKQNFKGRTMIIRGAKKLEIN